MFSQHPIFLIVISAIILILVILESLQKSLLLRTRLFFSFILMLFHILVATVYTEHIVGNENYEVIYLYLTGLTYLIFLLQVFITVYNANLKGNHYQLLIRGLKEHEDNVYLVLDKKDRVKDISQSLLNELNYEREEVINKKWFNIIKERIRFTDLNGKGINNNFLEKYFKEYSRQKERAKAENLELKMYNQTGTEVKLKLLMQPVYTFSRLSGKLLMGERKSETSLFEIEKNLMQTDHELESLRLRFLALLEVTNANMFTIDLDNEKIWFNDTIMKSLKLNRHEMLLSDFYLLIEKEDLAKYKQVRSNLSPVNSQYSVTYRIMVEGRYLWVREEGKRIYEDIRHSVILGIINPMKIGHYQKSGIDRLDNLFDTNQLMVDLDSLVKEGRQFQLALLRLNNVPEINEKHGRSIGNLIMAEYISKIGASFLTEGTNIYRVSGLDFAMTIVDSAKMDNLYRGINSQNNFLNLEMTYGSINVKLDVFVGICNMYSDAVNITDLYQNAERALKVALSGDYKKQGCYFKDIKRWLLKIEQD